MKKQIAKTFYDKEIYHLDKDEIVDAEGGVNIKSMGVLETFKSNVNFSNCKKIQEEYGLDYNIDISVTTNYDSVKINDIIQSNGVIYKVTDVLPSDSHILIVATKWRQ